MDAIAREFERHHPNIALAETQCGAGEQEFNEVLLARIAAGNPPDAAVLWTSPAALAARGALLPPIRRAAVVYARLSQSTVR